MRRRVVEMHVKGQLEIGVEGSLGVIALNRPEAINALSRDMIDGIAAQLTAWRGDPAIRAVLFEARGTRGFCSGGDVRAVRKLILDGREEEADAYFAAEYRMNAMIATYPKPVIAIADGIVMGGGIGIAGHARFRFTTQEAKYAMPEGAIGLVADVGVNWILAKAPENRALLFLLTGLPVSGSDVLALGLADCCVAAPRLAEVRSAVVAAANTGDIEPALVALMQAESIQAGERDLCDLADELADLLALPDAASIVAAIEEEAHEDAALSPYAAQLARLSPTNLEATVISHRAARRLRDVEAVLQLDFRMASHMARHPDFAEGVRAQLVDKDRRPNWQRQVDVAALTAAAEGREKAVRGHRVSTS
jgi:enoyl-CoA hydratase